MSETLECIEEVRCFDGYQRRYRHHSQVLGCDMTFSIFLPPEHDQTAKPVLWWLSGLTCNDQNFVQKAGAQRRAAELGLVIVCPDTSPRGVDIPGEDESYDLGTGAGFYLNATQAPWSSHYRMYDYVTRELPELVRQQFNVNDREAISGHSMGGHGALVCALRDPGRYASVSAFSPVANPVNCPWGEKAFQAYLGDDRKAWAEYDTCELIKRDDGRQPLLVEQGEADQFLESQLNIDELERVCQAQNHPLTLNRREGYDHSYFFIATYINVHLEYHAQHLNA